MARKTESAPPADERTDIEALYVEFLECFYSQGNRRKAAALAVRMEAALAESQGLADSIRGEEIRSLTAEVHGDVPAAIRAREAEIRKILELHTLTVNTPDWDYVARQYDYTDVADRLDLLAILYDRQGDTHRAISTLRESQHYCGSHQIPFDGQEMLDELQAVHVKSGRNGVQKRQRASKVSKR